MQGVKVTKYDPDSYLGTGRIVAVAITEVAALRWIEAEVCKSEYMQGKIAQWWIDQGYFALGEIEIQQ